MPTAMVVAVLAAAIAGPTRVQAAAPTTTLVTVGMDDAFVCCQYDVSAHGRFVAFTSQNALVAGDTNGRSDAFVHDRLTGKTELIDVAMGGAQANGDASNAAISRNGRYVYFESDANNLVPHDHHDVDGFLWDRRTDGLSRIPLRGGPEAVDAVLSGNGRYLAWGAIGHDNEAFRYDRVTRKLIRRTIGVDQTGVVGISNNGATILVWADGGPVVWKPNTGRLQRFDQARQGGYADDIVEPNALSANGRFVLFSSRASNLVANDTNNSWDAFVRNLRSHTTHRVSLTATGRQISQGSFGQGISRDGHRVLFASAASNIGAGDSDLKDDLFLRNRWTHATRLCSVSATGQQVSSAVHFGQLAASGLFLFFISSEQLAAGSDGQPDLYSHGPGC